MKCLTLTPEIADIAKRVVWFEEPRQAISDPIRFLAYAMTYGEHQDMEIIRRQVSESDLREAVESAPPGIFDERSWAFWNLKIGRYPAPPMPARVIPD